MTMLMARGEQEAALSVFQSCWWLISIVLGVTGAAMCVALYLLPVADLLHLSSIDNSDARWILFWLGLAVLLGQLEQLLQSAYRCIARYSYGNMLKTGLSLVAFAVQLVPVFMGYGPRTAAKVLALANIAVTLILCIVVRRDIPWITYGWNRASFKEIKRLARPAIAFMGFPLGTALNLQGTLVVVGYALGPVDVAIFGTARTVSRVALQIVQMVNNTVWPELSIAFGAGNIQLVRVLHRRACQLALFISMSVVVVVALFGPTFLHHWTRGKVPPSTGLVTILLVVVVFYSLWSTSSTLVSAINQHERLALLYTIATAITVAVTYIGARRYGLYGAAASLLLSELIMDFYVLPSALRIAHDTWGEFLRSMLNYPPSLRPSAILARLRRTRPELAVKPELDT
ncbi:MAG TPA: lipopolysaccharide biosynthesis protein [Candidatus Aquilonibacter sp.]|nr:lipopolysaccharide biosynthesis protein [Candidatus Aquilonibacter sp.]